MRTGRIGVRESMTHNASTATTAVAFMVVDRGATIVGTAPSKNVRGRFYSQIN